MTIINFRVFSAALKGTLHPLAVVLPLPSICPSPRQLWIYFLYGSTYFGQFICIESYNIWSFVTSFLDLTQCFLGLSLLNMCRHASLSYSVDRPCLVCPSVTWWALNCLYFLTVMNNAATSIFVQVFVYTYVFISLGNIHRSGIAGSYSHPI